MGKGALLATVRTALLAPWQEAGAYRRDQVLDERLLRSLVNGGKQGERAMRANRRHHRKGTARFGWQRRHTPEHRGSDTGRHRQVCWVLHPDEPPDAM